MTEHLTVRALFTVSFKKGLSDIIMKLLKKLSAGILIAVTILAMFNILLSPLAIEDN